MYDQNDNLMSFSWSKVSASVYGVSSAAIPSLGGSFYYVASAFPGIAYLCKRDSQEIMHVQ